MPLLFAGGAAGCGEVVVFAGPGGGGETEEGAGAGASEAVDFFGFEDFLAEEVSAVAADFLVLEDELLAVVSD